MGFPFPRRKRMGRTFGFSDAYAKRDRALNARAATEKVWFADGSDGDARAGTARDPWVVNEDAARKQALADAPELEKLAASADDPPATRCSGSSPRAVSSARCGQSRKRQVAIASSLRSGSGISRREVAGSVQR